MALFFFFNNIELAAKLTSYFFYFLFSSPSHGFQTKLENFFTPSFFFITWVTRCWFHSCWTDRHCSLNKVYTNTKDSVCWYCATRTVLTALLEAKTSQAGFAPWHLLSTNKSDFMPPEQCHSLALHQFVSLFCFLSRVTQSICDPT